MSPEENRDRTRTQGGSSVKQMAYEMTLREGGFDFSALNKPGEFPDVSRSAARHAADWSSNVMNLRVKEKILTENPMLYSLVQSPKNAWISNNDLEELAFWEQLAEGLSDGLSTAVDNVSKGAGEVSANVQEFFKALPNSGGVSLAGNVVEGAGQIIYPLSPSDPTPLMVRIAKAGSASPEEVIQLREYLKHQTEINKDSAQFLLNEVLTGNMPEEEVYETFNHHAPEWRKPVSMWMQGVGQRWKEQGKNLFPPAPGYEDSLGRQAGDMVGPEITLHLIERIPYAGPVLAPLVGALSGAGEIAEEKQLEGLDEEAQTIAARATFGTNIFDDYVIGDKLKIPKGADVTGGVATTFLQAGIDGLKGVGKQIVENGVAQNSYAPDRSIWEGTLTAFGDSAFESLVEGIFEGVWDAASGQSHKKGRDSQSPEETQRKIDQIADHSASSNVRAQNPDDFGDYVRTVTKGKQIETIYIPADKWNDVVRSFGDDPKKVLEGLPGLDKSELNIALSSGGDVKLPVGTYAGYLEGGKYDVALRSHMRFDPNAKTPAEGQALRASESERSAQAKSDAEFARAAEAKNQTVAKQERQQDVQRLQASGVPPEQAQSSAVALDAAREVRSAKAGQTREDYSRENPPADASSINQGQPSSVNGAAGQAATGPLSASESVNGSRTAAQPPVSNDPSLKLEGPGSTPVWTPPQTPSSTAPNQSVPAEQLKATLQSSTAPTVQMEPPGPPPKILDQQGPAVPTETPWSARRNKLERNGR